MKMEGKVSDTDTVRAYISRKRHQNGAQILRTWKNLRLVDCCFTSTETVGLLGTGAQDGYLDFYTAPKLKVSK